jgi:hypothetical protein
VPPRKTSCGGAPKMDAAAFGRLKQRIDVTLPALCRKGLNRQRTYRFVAPA